MPAAKGASVVQESRTSARFYTIYELLLREGRYQGESEPKRRIPSGVVCRKATGKIKK